MRIQTVGADKGYFAKPFLAALFKRRVTPHVAAKVIGWEAVHQRVRRMSRTLGYHRSQRARKKIEELWGEAKCWHGFRRFRRRGLLAGQSRGLSDGVVAQFEETVETDAGSGIAHGHAGAGRAGEGERWKGGGNTATQTGIEQCNYLVQAPALQFFKTAVCQQPASSLTRWCHVLAWDSDLLHVACLGDRHGASERMWPTESARWRGRYLVG